MNESTEALTSRAHHLLETAVRNGFLSHMETQHSKSVVDLTALLGQAEYRMRSEVPRTVSMGAPSARRDQLAILSTEMANVRNSLLSHELSERTEMMQRVDRALQRLRASTSVEELVSRLPYETVQLGYTRALFSWVDHMRWRAHSAYSTNGSDEGIRLVQAGRQRPYQDLRTTFESELVQTGKPILHHDIRTSGRVHPGLYDITQSESVLGIPLLSGQSVVGFVSLDARAQTGTVEEFDRDLVTMLCNGAGIALERLRLLEKTSSQYGTADHAAEAPQEPVGGQLLPSTTPENTSSEALVAGQEPVTVAEVPASSALTRREEEIMQLVARGLTNRQIGANLHISEETAKSHIKSVLRKLDVSNRTEAVGIYRQGGPVSQTVLEARRGAPQARA